MGKIRPFCALLVAAWVCAACGGESDAQKKRIRELEEELTRLQNSHDRLDERLTSLEVTRSAPEESASPQPKSEQAAEQPQIANLERPPLKVFKLGPSNNGGGAPAAVEQEPPADEDSGEPRPVIRGSGQNVQKASGSAPAPGSKARGSKLSQNGSVAAPAKANR